jgi:lipopolysaccharide transport system ATP-binding protein
MYVRLGFAVAAHLEPEILVVDEVLAVGDAEFQKRCLNRMSEVAKEGRTILFVSHNMQLIRRLCSRAILLEHGGVVADGDAESVVRRYLASIEVDDSGRRRWDDDSAAGDDACRLYEIRVTDEDDEPRTTYFSSRPIYVTLDLELPEVNPLINIGVEVATVDGTVAFYTSFRDMPEGQEPVLVPGRNLLRAEIPAELLNSGRYVINLQISLHEIRWIVHEEAILMFDVMADHGESLFLSNVQRAGVVAPRVRWETLEADGVGDSVALERRA